MEKLIKTCLCSKEATPEEEERLAETFAAYKDGESYGRSDERKRILEELREKIQKLNSNDGLTIDIRDVLEILKD